MNYHIAFGKPTDLAAIERNAQAGKCPRHVIRQLSQRLGAKIHAPGTEPVSTLDKLRARIVGGPEHWALARRLASQVDHDDLIFCTGEDVGVPIAAACGALAKRPKVVVFFHNIDRPRGRLAIKMFGLAHKIDLFMACSSHQTNFFRRRHGVHEDRLFFLPDQTDTQFFRPGPVSPEKKRHIIASVGLEKRDYRTLAEATSDLELDVRISGFSRDAAAISQAFPDTLPSNMSRSFYEWPALVQLYRDADAVVVSLVENNYAAGVQVLLEATACARPVIVTSTTGLADYIEKNPWVTVVKPQDKAGLRSAILQVLNQSDEAEAKARAACQSVQEHNNSEQYVERMIARFVALKPG